MTTWLLVGAGGFAGAVLRHALAGLVPPDDEPQIGSTADVRAGLPAVKTAVALHVAFSERAPGSGYSLD